MARANSCKLVNETQCRDIFERFYPGYTFPSVRPDFLKNPLTKRNCELDGYNHELKIAFEYNGDCHYKFPNYWNTTNETDFHKYIARDKYKKQTCAKLGIKLIIIPYNIRGGYEGKKNHIFKSLNSAFKKGMISKAPVWFITPYGTK